MAELKATAQVEEPPAASPVPVAVPEVAARPVDGHRALAWVLRTGAVLGGSLFAASLALELLPASYSSTVAIDLLRKGGASVLLATPLLRLMAAGALLGLRGEYRYAVYAAAVMLLLAAAVGGGFVE